MEAGFLQEAKIAAGLNHPSIVTVFDAGRTDSLAYIAMERLKGSDLHYWLANNRSMSPENAAALIARVADAVHFAHRRGLIHRDIKPSNIFLGRDMKPKVLDFGIALAQEQQQGRPDEPKKLIGTPNYMSPEQALARPLDARSDVFSIGTILYELITGHRAFDGANIDEILTKVVKIDPPSVISWRPEVSPVMGEIIMRALAKEPANRYQTAAQLRNDLAAFAGRPVGPPTSPPEPEQMTAPRAPNWQMPGTAALISTGIAVAGLSLTFVLWLANGRSESDTVPNPPTVSAPRPAPPAIAAGISHEGGALAKTAPATAGFGSVAAAPEAAQPGLTPDGLPGSAATGPKSAKHAAAPANRSRALAAQAESAPAVVMPPEPGVLTLAITPWGQVMVDGKDAGVSPPLSHIDLPAGAHTIEVRNGGFPALVSQVQIEAGKTFQLQHRF